MSIYKYLLLVISTILFSSNIAHSATTFSKNLPKTKSSTKDSNKKTKLKLEDILADDIESIPKKDPAKNFKLVAIYVIGNKARVLLKDITKPEIPAKEYLVGDFLDDEQTITISKINFNPTARIELTDESGISYLLKPQNSEDQKNASTGQKSLPTYFSTGKNKVKRAQPSNGFSPPSPTTPSNNSVIENKDVEKKDDGKKDETKPEGALKTNQDAPPPAPTQNDLNKPPTTMTDSTRPANPFE